MSSEENLQPHFQCCCGVRQRRKEEDVPDGGQDVTDGARRNIKTCICCWCMGCNDEGVYIWLKNLLMIYNLAFWILGCCFIALGIYSEVMRQRYTEAEHYFVTPSILLLVIGTFSFVFSTLGMVGALRDNLLMLKIFIFAILFFLVLELICGILAFVFKDPAKELVNVYVLKGMTTYYDDADLKDAFDYIQREFQCCGGQWYRDWEVNMYHNCSAPGPSACGVPFSCCIQGNGSININSMCGYDTIDLDFYSAALVIHTEGCITAVLDFLWLNLDIMGGILLGVFLPQITGIFLGILFARCIKRIINTQRDSLFEENTLIRIRPIEAEELITDADKRRSYPRYLQRPSIISELEHETNPSFRVKRHSTGDVAGETPNLDKNLEKMEAGEVLLDYTALTSSEDEITNV